MGKLRYGEFHFGKDAGFSKSCYERGGVVKPVGQKHESKPEPKMPVATSKAGFKHGGHVNAGHSHKEHMDGHFLHHHGKGLHHGTDGAIHKIKPHMQRALDGVVHGGTHTKVGHGGRKLVQFYAGGGKVGGKSGHRTQVPHAERKPYADGGAALRDSPETSKRTDHHEARVEHPGSLRSGNYKGPLPKVAHGGHWIQGAIKHPGALHKQMGVPQGQKIPKAKLAAAATKGGTLGKRARLAETLGHMHHHADGGRVTNYELDVQEGADKAATSAAVKGAKDTYGGRITNDEAAALKKARGGSVKQKYAKGGPAFKTHEDADESNEKFEAARGGHARFAKREEADLESCEGGGVQKYDFGGMVRPPNPLSNLGHRGVRHRPMGVPVAPRGPMMGPGAAPPMMGGMPARPPVPGGMAAPPMVGPGMHPGMGMPPGARPPMAGGMPGQMPMGLKKGGRAKR